MERVILEGLFRNLPPTRLGPVGLGMSGLFSSGEDQPNLKVEPIYEPGDSEDKVATPLYSLFMQPNEQLSILDIVLGAKSGADPSALNEASNRNCWHLCCLRGWHASFRKMLAVSKAIPKIRDSSPRKNLLSLAVMSGNVGMVKTILAMVKAESGDTKEKLRDLINELPAPDEGSPMELAIFLALFAQYEKKATLESHLGRREIVATLIDNGGDAFAALKRLSYDHDLLFRSIGYRLTNLGKRDFNLSMELLELDNHRLLELLGQTVPLYLLQLGTDSSLMSMALIRSDNRAVKILCGSKIVPASRAVRMLLDQCYSRNRSRHSSISHALITELLAKLSAAGAEAESSGEERAMNAEMLSKMEDMINQTKSRGDLKEIQARLKVCTDRINHRFTCASCGDFKEESPPAKTETVVRPAAPTTTSPAPTAPVSPPSTTAASVAVPSSTANKPEPKKKDDSDSESDSDDEDDTDEQVAKKSVQAAIERLAKKVYELSSDKGNRPVVITGASSLLGNVSGSTNVFNTNRVTGTEPVKVEAVIPSAAIAPANVPVAEATVSLIEKVDGRGAAKSATPAELASALNHGKDTTEWLKNNTGKLHNVNGIKGYFIHADSDFGKRIKAAGWDKVWYNHYYVAEDSYNDYIQAYYDEQNRLGTVFEPAQKQ